MSKVLKNDISVNKHEEFFDSRGFWCVHVSGRRRRGVVEVAAIIRNI